jgi:NADH-quinone oxidoreductase subunit J
MDGVSVMDMINTVLLIMMVGFAALAVFLKDLVRAALSLAFMSALLAVLLYRLNSPYAAVFELSVVAGLITVLFVSTIALTREEEDKEPSSWPLYVFVLGLLLFGLIDISIMKSLFGTVPPGDGNVAKSFGDTLWGIRALDMVGQIAVIFGGVFGVLALLRDTEKDKNLKK